VSFVCVLRFIRPIMPLPSLPSTFEEEANCYPCLIHPGLTNTFT
jgi:hypothetical protein